MGMARIMGVALVAAVLGCVVAALVLVGSVDQTSFIPVPVMWIGTVLLVTPADRWLRRRGLEMPLRAVPVVIAGAAGFALIGWLLSGGMAGTAVMGSVYGMVTAACWAALATAILRRG